MNADPLEIQKFSELAHRWWDPTSEFRPLHEINPLRLEWINAKVPLAGKRRVYGFNNLVDGPTSGEFAASQKAKAVELAAQRGFRSPAAKKR